ncbi:MAG: hypothetical protein NPIRA01_20150 [Nitrospirales bacterium]|nr:MAG: hypothetical protein NPIRA01_20150 [Nitrospirales bacterium]
MFEAQYNAVLATSNQHLKGKTGSTFNAYSALCQVHNDRRQGYLPVDLQRQTGLTIGKHFNRCGRYTAIAA